MRIIGLSFWRVLLSCNCLVFGGVFDLKDLEKCLDEESNNSLAGKVVSNWEDRSAEPFHQIDEQSSWERIIPLFSNSQRKLILPEELVSSKVACKALAKYLPNLSNTDTLPSIFREEVCNFLSKGQGEGGEREKDTSHQLQENSQVIQVIGSIPPSWIKTHGSLFMKALTRSDPNPTRLKYLKKKTLAFLLNNFDNACHFLTLEAILSLGPKDLALISPNCIRVIDGLKTMNLSEVVSGLRKTAFVKYNGPLSSETIEGLSAEQVKNYGSQLKDDKICNSIELRHLNAFAASGITAKCLHGYLTSAQKVIGLGALWKSISVDQVKSFALYMEDALVNIPLEDFNFMTLALLKFILYNLKICPTTTISFWNEQKIRHISPKCLHKIFDEPKSPIKIGRLWQQIHWSLLNSFTNEMRLSWLNIHHDDFYSMGPDVLKVISSGLGICSALPTSFWTDDNSKSISGECLYEILSKREESIKLGNLWRYVHPSSIHDLSRHLNFSWNLIHPEDNDLVKSIIKRAVGSFPGICATLDSSFWAGKTIKYFTRNCLYETLSGAKAPVKLGQLWENIPSQIMQDFNTRRLDLLRNVAGGDFKNMPPEFLKFIFSLDDIVEYLPSPLTEIVLSPKASNVIVNPRQFAIIAKSAPKVAGQLLWYSLKLPENVLSRCDGDDIRGLKFFVAGEAELDWKELFVKLEERYSCTGRANFFNRMIQLISNGAKGHFCETLLDVDEYLRLSWIHRNLNNKCRLKLGFSPEYIYKLFNTPELNKESLCWVKMLESYDHQDWIWIMKSNRIRTFLADQCEFWGTIIEQDEWSRILKVVDKSILESIAVDCIFKLKDTLRKRLDLIPLLANDAFSKHQINQLPCRLHHLSPAQISQLSSKIAGGVPRQHIVSRITLGAIKALSFEQFQSLYKSQWIFIPTDIKMNALDWRLRTTRLHLPNTTGKRKNAKHILNKKVINSQIKDLGATVDLLSLVLEVYRDGNERIPSSSLLSFITFIRGSELRDIVSKELQKSPLLRPAIIGLVRSAKELRDYNHRAFRSMSTTGQGDLNLPHSLQFGFDRLAILHFLKKSPQLFAAPNVRIIGQGIIDYGGPIRALISQLVKDIERDLVTSYERRAFSLESRPQNGMEGNSRAGTTAPEPYIMDDYKGTGANLATTKPNTNLNDISGTDIIDGGGGNAKFSWGISKEAGLIVGLAFGKALQLDIRLPFALDLKFYNLLVDSREETIQEYYSSTYSQEIFKLKQGIINLFNAGKLEEVLYIIPRLESLRFTTLSAMAHGEEAKSDIMTRTNLWGCSSDDCYDGVKDLQYDHFAQKYIKVVLQKVLEEFKQFIKEIVRGLEMTLPPVREFKSLPKPISSPFSAFLPNLLNAEPLRGRDVLARVKFISEDYSLQSLVQDQFVMASEVFSNFVLGLGKKQLEHLVGVWTGASTLSLKYSELNVIFMPPDNIESYRVDFCNPPIGKVGEKGKEDYHLISPGEEYQNFFKTFARRLLGPDAKVSPNCNPEGMAIIPVRTSTCAKNLMIYLQTTEQMLNSLVDLLHTRLTNLWDN